jgi:DNA polymerase-3 subunit gamma/tau
MVMLRALAFRPDANPPIREASPVPAPQEAESQAKKPEVAAPEAQPPAAAPTAAEPAPVSQPAPQPLAKPTQPQQSNAAVELDAPPWQEPSASLNKEPSASSNKEPSASLNKEPSASSNKEPSASLNKEPSASPNKEPEPPAAQKIALQDFTPDKWIEIRKQLTIGASLGEIASHCLYQGRSGSQLQFLIDNNQTSLYDTAHQQTLGEALSDYFAEPLSVEITFGVAEQETPRAADNREKAERLAEAVDTLNADPSVIKFKQLFDGHLNEQSVRPID